MPAFIDDLRLKATEPFRDEDNVEYIAPAPSTWRRGRYVRR
jgi:hypothetical protein